MRKTGSSLALVGLLAGVSITAAPNYAAADTDDFFQQLLDAPTRSNPQKATTQREVRPAKKRRAAGHSDTVRENALQPEAFIVLAQKKLKPAEQMDELSTAVYSFLAKPGSAAVRVRATQRKPIVDFYQDNGFAPLWVGTDGLNDKAKRLLALMSKADEEGLRALDFLPASLADFNDTGNSVERSPSDLARLEIELTAAALDFTHQASAGRVKPIRISDLHSIKAKPVNPSKALLKLKETQEPDTYLASLQPTALQYKYLKKALAKYRNTESAEKVIFIPGGKLIKAGGSDSRIELVAKRLQQLGLYEVPAEQSGEDSSFYNPDLVAVVKGFQKKSGLNAEGIIGPQTLGALNGKSDAQAVSKIILSMERFRWLPQDLKSKYIFVNQAFFETWMMDGGKEVYRSDVIVGRPKFQSAVFDEEMETIVLNPNWYVPRSIIFDSMLPKLLKNPAYLRDAGYVVTDAKGQVVDSASIDWWEYSATMPFGIRQPPGPTNALGRVKFLFPNKQSIYMHDTPARNLFNNKVRAFSYGCIRLKKPMEFAKLILGTEGWSPERIEAAIATGENKPIKLKTKIPVYLGYYTAWADADGNVETRNDTYGRDRVLNQAFEQNIQARSSKKFASR